MNPLEIRRLGRMPYETALNLQDRLVEEVFEAAIGDQLLLLEHEPVYTIGRTPDQSSLRDAGHLPYPVFQTNRGGQATYHGPGQLIGYPIIDLRRQGQDLHRYLRALEGALIDTIGQFGVTATRREGLTGVWVSDRKIASIGVGIRHWITMHGFALNVCGDLSPFAQITPCGIAGVQMTSIERESRRSVNVDDASQSFVEIFQARFSDLFEGSGRVVIPSP